MARRRKRRLKQLLPSVTVIVYLTYLLLSELRERVLWLVVPFVIWGLYVLISGSQRQTRLRASTLADIDRMDPFKFEEYIGELVKMKGWHARVTKRSGDFGVDVIATNGKEELIAIQVKHSRNLHSVGPRGVQEIVTARNHFRCHKAVVVTNSFFTPTAIKLARSNRVELWDRERLAREIAAVHKYDWESAEVQAALLAGMGAQSAPKPHTKRCPVCGHKLVKRNGRYGEFLGCTGYPRCQYTRDLK